MTSIINYRIIFILVISLIFISFSSLAFAMQQSHDFGNVSMQESSQAKGKQPVIFRHWVHRSKHTCRLCHVDIEFNMVAGTTGVMEDDNKDGRYCGTCHDGKEAFAISECTKCHAKDAADLKSGEKAAKKAFFKFKKKLPKSRYGNKIDWNIAEEQNLIKTKDFIEGVSFPDTSMDSVAKDEPRVSSLPGLPGIIFSHKKHVTWTGCGMCHPDTFALDTGKTKMTMKEISAGKYCGICHGSVAFPVNDCTKCHSSPVK